MFFPIGLEQLTTISYQNSYYYERDNQSCEITLRVSKSSRTGQEQTIEGASVSLASLPTVHWPTILCKIFGTN